MKSTIQYTAIASSEIFPPAIEELKEEVQIMVDDFLLEMSKTKYSSFRITMTLLSEQSDPEDYDF